MAASSKVKYVITPPYTPATAHLMLAEEQQETITKKKARVVAEPGAGRRGKGHRRSIDSVSDSRDERVLELFHNVNTCDITEVYLKNGEGSKFRGIFFSTIIKKNVHRTLFFSSLS